MMSLIFYPDTWAYMYSSGTTGLPKCCAISHAMYGQLIVVLFIISSWFILYNYSHWIFPHLYEILPEDRIYAVLPLYHGGCGVIALSHMHHVGSTIVLSRRFSAKDFFPDLVKYRCTVSLYISFQISLI